MYENYSIGKLGEQYFINFINNNFSDIALAKDSGVMTAKENHIIGDIKLSLIRKNDGYFEGKVNTFKVEVKSSQYRRYPSFDIEAMQNGKLITTDEYISEIDYDLIICIGKFDGNPDNLDQPDILYTVIDAKKVKDLILNDKKWLVNHVNKGKDGIAYINSNDFECLGSDYFYSSYRFNNILNFINSHYLIQNESYKNTLNKKALYESIMNLVSKEVRKALNENALEPEYIMDADEIEQMHVVEPYSFETDREEQWYMVGLKDGLESAKRKIAEFGLDWEIRK